MTVSRSSGEQKGGKMRKVILFAVLLGLLLIVCCVEAFAGSKQPQETVAPSINGTLKVVNGHLVDQNDNVIQLQGVSTHGLSWYPEYVNDLCFEQLRNWGSSVVRLALYPAEYNGYCTGGDPSALRMLVKFGVDLATKNDMYVIIDWHVLSEGDPTIYQAQAEAFFDEMSRSYRDYNNVIYEICNEPNGVSWDVIKSYAEDIISVIRKNDPEGIILVGTPNWSQGVDDALRDPITGYDNIMYTLHFYAATHKEDLRNKMTTAADSGLPVFVSEYGICDASGNGSVDLSSADAWLRAMNDCGISHVQWNLSNKAETTAIIKSSVSRTYNFEYDDLTESGKWLYDLLNGTSGGMSGCAGCME